MRIAIVTETFLPSTDGIVTRLCATIKWLTGQGHEVLVIAPELGVTEFNGARVAGIPPRSFFLYPDKLFAYPSRKVKQYLREFRPDLVHVVNPAFLGVSGIYYGRRLKLPLIASYHTNVPQYADYYRLPFLKPILWWYFRLLHNRADMNLCTSQTVKDELDKRKFKNVRLWQRGVDTARFQPTFRDPAMRERLTGGKPERLLLLFVGRLASEKNIQSLRRVLDRLPNACLALVGDGPYRQELEEVFRGSATLFCGFLHGEELSRAYASADVFVFPSTTETLGLVLLEAMSAGLPVAAAESGPTREQVGHGDTGMLFDPEDPDGLLNAVRALESPDVRAAISAKAAAHARRFGWERPSEQLFGLYCEVRSKKKSWAAAVLTDKR